MNTRNDENLRDLNCFTCGEVVDVADFSLSSARLEALQKSLPVENNFNKIREALNGDGEEEFLCLKCAGLLDLVNDLESKLTCVKSTLSSLFTRKFDDKLSIPTEIDGACPRVGSSNSLQSDSSYSKSSQKNLREAEVIAVESKREVRCAALEEEKSLNDSCKYHAFSSDGEEMLKVHISSEHKEFECNECHLVFASSGEVDNHIKEKHLGKWICHVCDKVFPSKLLFSNHSRLHLKGLSEKSIERIEEENIDLNVNLLNEKSHLAVENHQCSYCEYSTSFKDLFDDHIRGHVALKLFKCVSCSLLFESRAQLDEHSRIHEKLMYVCGLCKKFFISRDLVINHIKETHKQSYSVEKADLKQVEKKPKHSNHVSNARIKNDVENFSSVASHSSSKINFHSESSSSSSARKSDNMKKEYVGVSFPEEITSIINPQRPKKEISRLSCKFAEGTRSTRLSENAQSLIDDTFLKIDSGSQIQENAMKDSDSSYRTLPRYIKGNLTSQDNHKSNLSHLDKERSHADFSQAFQNTINPHNDESGFSSVDICSVDLITHSSKKDSSINFSKTSCNIVRIGENNFNEKPAPEVKLSEESESYKSDELWESLNSPGDSQNVCEPLEENQGSSEEKQAKLFICGKCGHKSLSAPEIIEHMTSHTGGISGKELICDGDTDCIPYGSQQLYSCATTGSKFSCSYCPWKSDDKLDLRNHIDENHLKESAVFICRFCKKKCSSKLQLMHHELSHGRTKLFHCKICRKGFSRENLLNRHKRIAHSSNKCCFCTKAFHSLEELSDHKSKHEQEGGYQCLECPRIFKTKTGLKFHSAQHTGEYKFRCQYCDQGFMSRVVYQEHMGKHTKEERYICDICGRKFCFQSTYWIHRKWHDNPFPYKCDICDRPFRHSSLLKVHKRQHTGERPYHCPHCSRSFSVSGTLKRHLMLHTGDYAFTCEDCDKGFTTRNKFALHLSRVHGNDSLLQQGPPKTEFKMVIRDSPKSSMGVSKEVEGKVNEEDLVVENYEELDSMMVQDGGIVGDGADLLKESSLMLPCSILDDVNGSLETRVVEILVNDETSQAVATVTVEGNPSLVSW